jgi:hypothetical protein
LKGLYANVVPTSFCNLKGEEEGGLIAMVIGGKVGLVRNQGLQISSSSSIDVVLARFTSLSNTEEGGLLVVLDFF